MKLLWFVAGLMLLLAIILPWRLMEMNKPATSAPAQAQSVKPAASTPAAPQPQAPSSTPSQAVQTPVVIPTLSATDTAALVKENGRQVRVTGKVTHIEWTEPQAHPNETWTLVFFNANPESDVASSSRNRTSPWDYTSYFRLIIKPAVADSLSVKLLKDKTVTASGLLDLYLGAPVIYIESASQVEVSDTVKSPASALKLKVSLPEKIYFEQTADEQLTIQNVSNENVWGVILYESGTQPLWKPTCGTAYQGGARIEIGNLGPGQSVTVQCKPRPFAQYNVPVQPGQRVPIELWSDSSDSYGQHLATVTLTLDPSARYFNVEIGY